VTSDASLWFQQCEAARTIKARFGSEKALGYLLGEKFLNFLRVAYRDPGLAVELPRFVEEVREVFSPGELRGYFSGPRRIGAAAHVLDDDGYEVLRSAGALEEDVVTAAGDAIQFERMRRLVLGE
jgi:hypothetical protein